jgi:hypothetical protein
MHISKTNKKIILHRYGGVNNSKSIMAKIGEVPVGTKPDEILDELKLDLTPRELIELVEHLSAELVCMATQKVDVLVQNYQEMLLVAKDGLLSVELVEKLDTSASEFIKSLRRISAVKKSGNVKRAAS